MDDSMTALRSADWRIEPRRNLLIGARGDSTRLEPQMMEVLLCLTSRPGEVLSRDELIKRAWRGRLVSDESLSVAVHGLRKALGDDARRPKFIETVPKRGYRWLAPVEVAGTEAAAADARQTTRRATQRHRRPSSWRRGALLAALYLIVAMVSIDLAVEGIERAATADPKPLGSEIGQPSSDAARRAFELGYMHIMRLGADEVEKARVQFERTVELDPGFAAGWAGLVAALVRSSSAFGLGADDGERVDRARFAAAKALELDPALPAAQVAAARVRLYLDWHPVAAEDHLREALRLDPDDPHTYQLLAAVHLSQGRLAAAEASARQAVALEPGEPVRLLELAGTLVYCGRPLQAMVEIDRALELDPRLIEAAAMRPFVALLAGDEDGFFESWRSTWPITGLPQPMRQQLEQAHAEGGTPNALRRLVELSGDTMPNATRFHLLTLAGDAEMALTLLETSIENRNSFVLWNASHPATRRLAGEPGYKRLLRRIDQLRRS